MKKNIIALLIISLILLCCFIDVYAECVSGDCINGYGIYEEGNEVDSKYEGQWKNGKKHGQGTWFDVDLKTYEGQWQNDNMKGQGILYYPNGQKQYEGQFQEGLKQGKGTSFYFSGKKEYEGQFREDKKNGQGVWYNENGITLYSGQFQEDIPSGVGIKKCINGNCVDGYGVILNKNYTRYEGQWKSGKKHGQGILYHPNGQKEYEGEFKQDTRDGKGIEYVAENGMMSYEGQWKNNKKEGYGVGYAENGVSDYEGQWKDGKQVKSNIANSKVDNAKKEIVKGVISDYGCGDNCYLTIKDSNGKEISGLCTAPLCQQWNENAEMPAKFKGKKVIVTVGKGLQYDGEGNVMGETESFEKIDMLK